MGWMSLLVEAGYFTSLELFFLIAGHTHNPVDGWFSVLGRAIKDTDFIGSILAMQELFKYATIADEESDTQQRECAVVELKVYHDYNKFLRPVLNKEIKNYGLPHRFIFELHPVW